MLLRWYYKFDHTYTNTNTTISNSCWCPQNIFYLFLFGLTRESTFTKYTRKLKNTIEGFKMKKDRKKTILLVSSKLMMVLYQVPSKFLVVLLFKHLRQLYCVGLCNQATTLIFSDVQVM